MLAPIPGKPYGSARNRLSCCIPNKAVPGGNGRILLPIKSGKWKDAKHHAAEP